MNIKQTNLRHLQVAHSIKYILQLGDNSVSRLDRELLLATAIKRDITWLHTWPEYTLSKEENIKFNSLIKLRADGKPVAYIVGVQEFWSLELKVTPATLIPRPESELLVEQALTMIPLDEKWRVADLGTGSGALAIAIATERPNSKISATDISTEALSTAQDNAQSHHLKNIKFYAGSWFEPLQHREDNFNLIISNPPYIELDDPHLNRGDLRYEPITALTSGRDGLNDIKLIVKQAVEYLDINGVLMIEHGYNQGERVRNIFKDNGFLDIKTLDDLAGHERVSYGRR